MSEKINLEEIFNKYRRPSPNLPGMVDISYFKSNIDMMICEGISQALKLAAENAELYCEDKLANIKYTTNFEKNGKLIISVNKQSILDTIKQVE